MDDWISVKDKWPQAYDYVLVYAGDGAPCPMGIARYDDNNWQPLDSFIGACFGDVSFEYDSEDITHWMPLPSPPNHIVHSDKKVEDTPTTNSLEQKI